MQEWTTLSIKEETRDRFNEMREEMEDGPRMTADLFLNSLMDTWDAVDDGCYSKQLDEDTLEEIKNAVSMAADPTVEVDVERIMKRLDDLETELTRQHEEMQR